MGINDRDCGSCCATAGSQRIGDRTVVPKHVVQGSPKWARLEDGSPCALRDFIDRVRAPGGEAAGYLHDWGLPARCPELVDRFVVPKYFRGKALGTRTRSRSASLSPAVTFLPHGQATCFS